MSCPSCCEHALSILVIHPTISIILILYICIYICIHHVRRSAYPLNATPKIEINFSDG